METTKELNLEELSTVSGGMLSESFMKIAYDMATRARRHMSPEAASEFVIKNGFERAEMLSEEALAFIRFVCNGGKPDEFVF